MKNIILIVVFGVSLVGCASSHSDKLTHPKGQWQLVNQAGFVPSSAKRYVEGVDIYIQDTEDAEDDAGDTGEDAELTRIAFNQAQQAGSTSRIVR